MTQLDSATQSFETPFSHPVYRYLFAAQLCSLFGTGVFTIGLALLAYQISPLAAGTVLAMALIAKMLAYITVAPVVGAYVDRLPRKHWLLVLDLARAGCLLVLPWIESVFGLVSLVFVLNTLAAGFTPVYQSVLPDLLSEGQYTKALGWSRTASELENILSPSMAGLVLLFANYQALFVVAGAALLSSALCLLCVQLPDAKASQRERGFLHNLKFGLHAYLATPRLKGVLAIHGVVCFSGSMIIVNTVVLVRQVFGLDDSWVPAAGFAAGVGAMLSAAFVVTALQKKRLTDAQLMLSGAVLTVFGLLLGTQITRFSGLIGCWLILGFAQTQMLMPMGRLILQSCLPSDRTALYAANFSLSHAIWLLAYGSAGFVAAANSEQSAF